MDRIIEMQMMEIHRWNASWITVRGMNRRVRRGGERTVQIRNFVSSQYAREVPLLAFDGFLFGTKFTGHVDSAFHAVCCIAGFRLKSEIRDAFLRC